MGNFRYSGNIQKERYLFNTNAMRGIEETLKTITRDDNYNEEYTERIGKGILTDLDIQLMGKIFGLMLHKESTFVMERICTITIHKHQLIPATMQFIKYLQYAGWEYKGHAKEQTRVGNQITLVLNLIKGLDPSLRIYNMVDALVASIWHYYFYNHQISYE